MCQVKTATDAIVLGLQFNSAARQCLYEQTARRIAYYQRRNAMARASHRRTTIGKLHRKGITLSALPRCDKNTS